MKREMKERITQEKSERHKGEKRGSEVMLEKPSHTNLTEEIFYRD